MVRNVKIGDCGEYCWVIDGYKFDLKDAVQQVLRRNKKRIILEAPQGFIKNLKKISELLESRLNNKVEIHLRLEPAYGACSLSTELIDENTFLIHIGHDEYPYPIHGVKQAKGNYYLIAAEYIETDVEKMISSMIDIITNMNYSKLAIGYTTQHKTTAIEVGNFLLNEGFTVQKVVGVTGCFYYNLIKYKESVDAYFVIAGGAFHGLGLSLALNGRKPVFVADPYTYNIRSLEDLFKKILAKRYWFMYRALEGKHVGIIDGLLAGQCRPPISRFLSVIARKHGFKPRIILARYVNKEFLDNLGPSDFDFFVTVSCPRLAIEDLSDYWKPVLTPAEARLVFRKNITEGEYTFPW